MVEIYSNPLLLPGHANERLYPLRSCQLSWNVGGRGPLLGNWKDKISRFIADRYRFRWECSRNPGRNDSDIYIQNRRRFHGGMGIPVFDFTRLCNRISKISRELDRSSGQR